MTEDEAHQTKCCGPEGCGRFNEQPYGARWCVGSGCMAWRWRKVPNPEWRDTSGWATTSVGQPNPLSRPPYGIDSETDGYCGLAGTVQ